MGRHAAEVPAVEPPQVTEREMPNLSDVRARHQTAAMAGEHAHHAGGFDKGTAGALTRSWADVSDLHDSLRVLACDLLAFAEHAGMPATYWHSDTRVRRALAVLDLTPEQAQQIDWTELPTPR